MEPRLLSQYFSFMVAFQAKTTRVMCVNPNWPQVAQSEKWWEKARPDFIY